MFEASPLHMTYEAGSGAEHANRTAAAISRSATRALDIGLSLAVLIFLMPLLVLVAIVLFICDPGPIIFAQRRVGYGGREFRCLKFRSMAVDAQERLDHLLRTDPAARAEWQQDQKLKNDPRIVGIGRFLRMSSIDEFPQFFNVLCGDMSLVGPRPIIRDEVPRYGRYFPEYCRVRPGITGLWQISGRSTVSYRRRVAMDVVYVRSKSLRLDAKILFYTLPSVLLVKGAH